MDSRCLLSLFLSIVNSLVGNQNLSHFYHVPFIQQDEPINVGEQNIQATAVISPFPNI